MLSKYERGQAVPGGRVLQRLSEMGINERWVLTGNGPAYQSSRQVTKNGPAACGVTIGDRIRQVRGEMTQREFGELLGISAKTVLRLENGERKPDTDLILKLHVLFRVEPLWLIAGVGQDVPGPLLSPKERALLTAYRGAGDDGRTAIEAVVRFARRHDRQDEEPENA